MNNKYFMTVKCENGELDKAITNQAECAVKTLVESGTKPIGIDMVKTENGFTMAIDETTVVFPTIMLAANKDSKNNKVEISIKCNSMEAARKVGKEIDRNIKACHHFADKAELKISLNYDSEEVSMMFESGAKYYPQIMFRKLHIVPKDTKYEAYVNCRNQELKDLVLPQLLQQATTDNRNKIIIAGIHLLPEETNFEFFIKDSSRNMPVVMFGFKEGLHTETEFDKASNFDMRIKCPDKSTAAKIGAFIHNQFCGLKDYVDSKILLNCDTEDVVVVFGAESDYYPIFLFVEEI